MLLLAAETSASANLQSFHVAPWAWALFVLGLGVLLLLDLFVLHKDAHVISVREAAVTSAMWVALGVSFTFVIWFWLGGTAASQYITGYIIEKSLSVDNVFVWAVIFGYFSVPKQYQHRVLFWGIFGALALRAIFVFTGVALLSRFEWLMFVFGAFLVYTGLKVAKGGDHEIHPENNPLLKLVRRIIPVSADYDGQKLFTRSGARRLATPLFIVLVLIEATDVVFAVDSVPAILAISRDQFIVFSSNALAILGLRSLYFLLASAEDKLVHLNKGLGLILGFVGIKMLASHWYHLPTLWSLLFIAVVLTVTVIWSLQSAKKQEVESR